MKLSCETCGCERQVLIEGASFSFHIRGFSEETGGSRARRLVRVELQNVRIYSPVPALGGEARQEEEVFPVFTWPSWTLASRVCPKPWRLVESLKKGRGGLLRMLLLILTSSSLREKKASSVFPQRGGTLFSGDFHTSTRHTSVHWWCAPLVSDAIASLIIYIFQPLAAEIQETPMF